VIERQEPAPVRDNPLPIIDPGHIEMSEPAPADPAPGSSLPVMPPLADFAAASEILAQRQGDENEPER
jgi:hypothetical protein